MPVGYDGPNGDHMTAARSVLPPNSPVTSTVYSVVWPDTEHLVRQCMRDECELMLSAHRHAHTKRQDPMHEGFFNAWRSFARHAVSLDAEQLPECYPTAGSSEAIREIIREAVYRGEDLVVFDGEYEGYEAIAQSQGTRVHRIPRADWKSLLTQWAKSGPPWGPRRAQWWLSQPSAIDGNVWPDCDAFLMALAAAAPSCRVWMDLSYVGRARQSGPINVTRHANVAGLVFSLSKVMGVYYRRIGGCMSRAPIPGLWANRWFKNLDSLYLGQRWLEQSEDALNEGARYQVEQVRAMDIALDWMRPGVWAPSGIVWRPSDVPLLMHATNPHVTAPDKEADPIWGLARRGNSASRRLCITPALERVLGLDDQRQGGV